MTADVICENLLRAATADERAVLMAQAEHTPECVEWLLAQAARILSSAPREALKAAELAAELAKRRQDRRCVALAERTHAQALRALGCHEEALTAFDTAAQNALESGDLKLAAQVQIGRIDSLGWLGRHAEAVAFAQRLIADLRREQAEEDAARALVNLGNVHYRRDRFHEALHCYEEASAALAECGDAVAAARVDFNRANILSEHHQAEEALRLFQQTRRVFEANGLELQVAMTDFNIGVLTHRSGEYAAALAAQQRARGVFAEQGLALEAAKCDADMGDVYRLLNLHAEALEGYESAIEVFETIPLDYERGRAELGRAAILVAQGDTTEAMNALNRAVIVFDKHRNAVQQAHTRLLRACLRRAQHDEEGAAAEARAAGRAFTRFRLFTRAAEARYIEADIALQSGQNATRKMAGVRAVAKRYAQGWLECRAAQALGQYWTGKGQTARALQYLRVSVQALEAARTLVPGEDLHTAFVSDKMSVYEDIVALLLARGNAADIAEAFEYVERAKSRLLLERVQAALAEPEENEQESGSSSQQTRLAELRARLNRLYSQMQPQEGEGSRLLVVSPLMNTQTLSDAEEVYRAALRTAELESGTGLFELNVTTVAELQSCIKQDEILVEFYIAHGRVCAFVLTREGITVRRELASAQEIEHLARRLRFHLHRAGSAPEYVDSHTEQLLAGVQKPLAQLYDLLLRPLESWLAAERITLVLHGVLHNLPFHAFFDGTRYALDRWEFVYSPSATLHYTEKMRYASSNHLPSGRQRKTAALVMGVPDAGLAQIATEIANLAQMLPDAEVFCGMSATLDAFRAHARHSRLIHLATHALFRADNPLFSGLRFADGWLLARDLYTMRLPCDLVTLSACRTGQSQVESGDEMIGLLRGFLAAGVRAVAVSLWPAEDAATAALMTRFYALQAKGHSFAAALRAAQKYVREQWPHPYHWAAFALFGDRGEEA